MNRTLLCVLAIGASLCVGVGASVAQSKSDDSKAAKRAAARQLIDAAIKEASLLWKADEKVAGYLSVADAQMKVGDIAAARQSVETATKAAAAITEDTSSVMSPVVGLYIALTGMQAETGDVAGAKSTIAKIHDGWGKAAAYGRIAAAQLQMKDVPGARQTLASAKSEVDNCKATYYGNLATIYIHITEVWAQTGDISGAKAFVAQFPDAAELAKAHGYRRIANAQAKTGDVTGAYQTVELARTMTAAIRDESARIFPDSCIRDAYTEIAKIQLEAGDIAGAKATLARLQEVVRKDATRQPKEIADLAEGSVFALQLLVYLEIAAAQAKAGNVAEARQTIAAAKTAAEGIDYKLSNPNGNIISKIRAYSSIMTMQAKAGDRVGARETLETARMLIPTFSPEYSGYKSWAYREIAEAQAEAGDVDGAIEFCARVQSQPSKRCEYLTYAAGELCSKL